MKRIFFVFFGLGLLFFLVMLSFPSVQADSQKTIIQGPYISIQYETKPGICAQTTNDQINNFGVPGWRLVPGLTDYQINYSTKPPNFSDEAVKSIIELAFSTVQGGGGGILFHYAGDSSELKTSNDRRNTVMWQVLPGGIAAMTYIWTEDGRLVDADTIFNKRYSWTSTDYNGQNDCGGPLKSFDLRNIATHEFGHWVGLGDLYNQESRDLTMYGFASRGELKKTTLGLGDITAIRGLWP